MGLLLSLLVKSCEIIVCLHTLCQFQWRCWCNLLLFCFATSTALENRRVEHSTNADCPQNALKESMGSETGPSNSRDRICSEEGPSLLTEELKNLENNLQEMVLTDSLESSFKERNQGRSDEYGILNAMHYDSLSDDETSSDTKDNVHDFPAGVDHEHHFSLGDDRHGRVMDSQNRRICFLTPVKEERDSSSEEEQFLPRQRLNRTFPIFGDKETFHHELPLFRRRLRHSRRKPVCSVSSDSGIGEALQESSNTSTSAGSSLCASTSDSSDCNSSTHSCDLSSAAHTDDLEGSSDGAANEVFCHDLAEGIQENPFDIKGDVSRPQEELASAVWSKFQNNSKDPVTSTDKSRPVLAPLNFRARRKVLFGDGEGKLDLSASSQESSSSSPSTPSSSCSSSSFVKSFRPLFSRQDSEESSSSVSSGDSILAVPLSPHSPTADDNTSPFQFPEVSLEKHCFSEPRESCDLVLLAEGEQFHVHTAVVAWQCTALLQHLRQTGSKEVVLLNKRAADVLCLLRLLYPSYQQPITEDNVSALVELAHYLSCERVLRLCTTYLIGLAHLHHLCPHRHLPPSPPPRHSPRLRSGMFKKGLHAEETHDATAGRVCTCADTMAERVLDILGLAASYELEDVYHAYLDVAAKVKATEFINCPRFKYVSAVIRQDVLTSRLTRLEKVMDNVSLQKSHLVTCRHQHHDSSRLNYSGPLCLKCSSRRLLQKAQNMG